MIKWLKKVILKKTVGADDILKYPQGKRYYQDFHNIRKSYIDPDAIKVISRIQSFGYKAYIVGGCVRDLLLGKQPKDYDVVTNAKPNEIRKIFANSRLIGRRFKIVHIVFRMNKIIEVSTTRSLPDSRNSGKKAEELYLKKDNKFGTFKEDAARRDFTINSLFFDIRSETIIDYTGGVEDLKEKLIRIIGDEDISFPEDPVRMLRAVKFSALLGFNLHSNLIRGIKKHKRLITKTSIARLHEEFNKIFRTGQSYAIFKDMFEYGIFEAMFPVIAEFAKKTKEGKFSFEESGLGKRLMISDKMIFEHEDINTNIYYSILIADVLEDLMSFDPKKENINNLISERCKLVEEELGLSKKELEKIEKIFSSQRIFAREVKNKSGWVKNFKTKDYFQEAFIFYKINARSRKDDEAVQKALFWEIGMRKKLPNAIRKPMVRKLTDYASRPRKNVSYNK